MGKEVALPIGKGRRGERPLRELNEKKKRKDRGCADKKGVYSAILFRREKGSTQNGIPTKRERTLGGELQVGRGKRMAPA